METDPTHGLRGCVFTPMWDEAKDVVMVVFKEVTMECGFSAKRC